MHANEYVSYSEQTIIAFKANENFMERNSAFGSYRICSTITTSTNFREVELARNRKKEALIFKSFNYLDECS